MLQEYFNEYLLRLKKVGPNDFSQISKLVAYRLTTTFRVRKMSRKDQQAVVALAGFFLEDATTLQDKLSVITNGSLNFEL